MKYKIIPIAEGVTIASSVHSTYRICRRFASPQCIRSAPRKPPRIGTSRTRTSACPQRGHLPISGSVGATKKNNGTVKHR